MKKIIPFILFLFLINIKSFAQTSDPLHVQEYKLSNGLTVWINEDHSLPQVEGIVVVKAGAKHSPNTGIAHYFEHIMFKGTDKIGTIDYAAEKVYLDSIAMKYDELAQTTDEEERKSIQKEINELSIKASDYAIPNEFDRLISLYGGTGLNAFTSYDITAYFNAFSPQYFNQWAEIYSERFANPVFRLFQSELETVYEEKNMYDNSFFSVILDTLTKHIFQPHPYMYSIIGSTENLKNPRLSEMKQFYEDYYVGSNMGLIISGDINTNEILPVIEERFSRIPAGNAPQKTFPQPKDFSGEEKLEVKVPIPLIKIGAQVRRSVPENHDDEIPLNIISKLLNNENSTGYLDKLSNDRKVMAAGTLNMSMADAGVLITFVAPKLLFQSNSKAKKLVNEQIERIKAGDFTEEQLNSIKNGIKKDKQQEFESAEYRAFAMMYVFSQGKKWDEYIKQIEKVDSYTKEDIVAIANKYFTENYLDITKKTGKYPKEHLQKPDFEPIVPKNREAQSEYAKELGNMPSAEVQTRFIDFDKDVKTISLNDKTTLYVKENPINDIFFLRLSFGKGSKESKLISPLTNYLNNLGTDTYSFDEFRSELQKLNSTLKFNNGGEKFTITIDGFDEHFDKTIELVSHFIYHVKGDKEKLKQIVDIKKIDSKSYMESADFLADGLFEKVRYGDKSEYLNQLSLAEIKKLKSEDLLSEFTNVLKTECTIHYSGKLPSDHIAEQIKQNINIENITLASNNPIYTELIEYIEPTVFFMNYPQAKQSIIYLYSKGKVNEDRTDRIAGSMFSSYFGGSMGSLVFQEIREFRSLAYGAFGRYAHPIYKHKDKPGYFYGYLSTQNDKTIEAMQALDSLVKNMPVKPERLKYVRQNIINNVNNSYPSFREMSYRIASLKEQGFSQDPDRELLEKIQKLDMDDIELFYSENIKNNPLVYIIVGDEKKLDMERIAEFGKIIKVKHNEIYK